MNWHLGQKVVCVDDRFTWVYPIKNKPMRGFVYTIRGFNVTPGLVGTGIGIYLEEVKNSDHLYDDGMMREMSFDQAAFLPTDTDTNISVFYKMLDNFPKVHETV